MVDAALLSQGASVPPITGEADERLALAALEQLLDRDGAAEARLVGAHGETVELPRSARRSLQQLVHLLAQGHTVAVLAVDKELTTQQAADILNVSRPFLVQLLDQGAIPFTKTGTHRRLRFNDLMAYKHQRDEQRRQQLRELTRLGAELGLYQMPELDEPPAR